MPKARDGDVVIAFSGKWVSWAHTIVAYSAFIGALITGLSLHYHKIVQNEYYGYPQEWFPSVSSTIGDRYPERAVFQFFIAVTSGPRFALVFLWYILTARPNKALPKFVAGTGFFRTLTCGGWTYVTSTDDHGWHDIFMISYLVATLPWTLGCLHKVHKVPGAYTTYAFFEWALIFFDVGFDAVTAMDFDTFELVVRDRKGSSRGQSQQIADVVLEKENDKILQKGFGSSFSWSEAFDVGADVYNGKPEYRLFAVAFGVSMACLAWSATWYAERSQIARLEARILAWNLGLIMSSLSKFAFWTNNPTWPIMHADNGGWNKIGLLLAFFSILRSTRSIRDNRGGSEILDTQQKSWILAGLGLAGLLFGMHSLLSDSSTMILWVWEGFPVKGPIAANGVLTIAAMGLGVLSSIFYAGATMNLANFLFATLGGFLITRYHNWTGFTGALLLATCLPSLASPLITSAVRHGPVTFGLGFLVYNILVLAHVWVVAYAFVPGGPLLREHTDWVMMVTILFLGAGVYAVPRRENKSKRRPQSSKQVPQRYVSYYTYVLALLELLALSVSYLRFPTNDYQPYHKNDKVITAGIWTIHFSLDNDMWSSERRIRDLVKDLEIDVIGFLESDLQRIIMGNRDTTQYIAEDLGMYVDYGPGPNKHTWGSALLSKFPILNSTHHLLPSPVGELAPAIHATLDAYGELVDVIVFHSGQEEDPEDRRLQSEYLAKMMRESPRPVILLSYLVVKPLEGNYNTYVGERSGMRDIDPSDWDRWCEYILYKGIRRTGYARVSRSTITDTELQVGKFVVGQGEGSNERVDESQVPDGLRFPSIFRGPGGGPDPKPAAPSSTSTPAAKSKPSPAAAAQNDPDPTKHDPPSTITRASTIVVTAPGQTKAVPSPAAPEKKANGPNTAGIAAGVVVGIAAVGAIAGGLFFFLRNRKRRAVEAGYHRNSASSIVGETRPPPSSHSMSDSRLEPSVMMQRRQSDVSIADNQDYSRRILKAKDYLGMDPDSMACNQRLKQAFWSLDTKGGRDLMFRRSSKVEMTEKL
ncbi:MAG: hypothetical protein LQ351_006946 [Letrouitia transgressa]|nr:MAG: hypothetical protein LQ351_006946 [Letrouitia transgressa]